MPYVVIEDTERCPVDKPWAVTNPESGRLHGCHPSKEKARQQQAALYVNVPDARSGEVQRKTFDLIESKSEDSGSFTALASVFGNVDKGGDRMMKGAFSKTLAKLRESGKALPIILSHQWDDIRAYVGKADPRAIYEDERGLVVQGQLFMDDPDAKKVHRLMKEGLLTGWSFGYHVPAGGRKNVDGVNEISEVELYEAGPTLVGMNDQARLEAIKSVALECEQAGDTKQTINIDGAEWEIRKVEKTSTQSEHGPNEEPSAKSRPDALKDRSRAAVLDVLGDGVEVKRPAPQPEPEPDPELEYWALRERSRAAMLDALRST